MLVEALHQAGQGALGRVVLSNQCQLVLVRASSRLLVLDVLHYPSQVRNVGSWEADLPKSAATDSERPGWHRESCCLPRCETLAQLLPKLSESLETS